MRTRFRPVAVSLIALLAAACADAPAPPADEAPAPVLTAPAPAGPSLAAAQALGIPNAHQPLPHLLTAGALTQAQMAALADAGYVNFISLRSPQEDGSGWEEAFTAAQGFPFQRIPVTGAGGLTRENVEALDALLDAAGDAPTVLYCGSANRVGALMALRAAWMDGAAAEDALALGRSAGLLGLEPAVAQLLAAGGATR
jgi:uncharacterized protein (TIGR01244 family)